jgi:RsmE family RNA methyltransferase
VNIILFAPDEFSTAARAAPSAHATPVAHTARDSLALPRADARAAHILGVLRRQVGGTFDAGIIDGPRGKATLAAIPPKDGALSLTFSWDENEPPPLPPITLVIGLPRPQTARKNLNEATSLGVPEMHFVTTGRGEPSYAQSTLWTTGEYRRHLVAGAAQAFCTRIPRVTFGKTPAETIAALATVQPSAHRIALDNYESPSALSEHLQGVMCAPLVLAFGPERGWTAPERAELRAANFAFANLGERVLRTETAVTAALALALAHLERM